jgi:hypothetical protein
MSVFGNIDQGTGLALAVFLAAAACALFLNALHKPRSQRRKFRPHFRPPRLDEQQAGSTDVGRQMHAVLAAPFAKRRLLSPSEFRVFRTIETDVTAEKKGHRVFAQTSLGEVLQSPDHDAFHSINAKRVDMLIVDRGGWPVLAVEYQGEGHHQGTAAARDAIKKEALRRAGVDYVEVFATDSEEQIRFRVREKLGWKAAVTVDWRPALQHVVAKPSFDRT